MVSLPTVALNDEIKLWFCYGCISYWDLFCSCCYILSVYSGLAGNPELPAYMRSCIRFLALWRNLLLWYQIALKVTVCTIQAHAAFTWNETKSFACRLCNWQKKIQLLSGNIGGPVLSDKGNMYFLLQSSGNEELTCVIIVSVNPDSVVTSSPYPVKEVRSLKKC